MPFTSHFANEGGWKQSPSPPPPRLSILNNHFTHALSALDTRLRNIPSSILVAILACLTYVALLKATLLTARFDEPSFSPANGFIVGTWLQLTFLQNALFLPLAFVANIIFQAMSGESWPTSVLFTSIDTFECVMVVLLIRRFAPKYKNLASQRSTIVITVASVIGSCIGAFAEAALVVKTIHEFNYAKYGEEFFKWFMSDCLGLVAVVFFMLSLAEWPTMWARVRKNPSKGWMAIGCLVFILFLEVGVPIIPEGTVIANTAYTIRYIAHIFSFPLVLLCGMFLGTIGFTTGTLVMAVSGVVGIVLTSYDNPSVLVGLLLRYQLFIIVVMISSLALMVIETSRQSALADALRANTQKSAFMAFLCHELRNPLHAILNINTFLKESSLANDQHQYCEAISIASMYMSQIINDVLDTSKFEAGHMTLDQTPVDL
ncbi:hypothetical protein BC829DRAFT_437409, partial [Chytridium lagenaria]